MKSTTSLVFGLSAFLANSILPAAAQYTLQDKFDKSNFFSQFSFFEGPDPTNGFVQYTGGLAANKMSMAGYVDTAVYLGVDHITVNPDNGRRSVRLTSKKAYTEGLFIADISHMPGGPGVWPAYWMFGPNWPNAGEIDIIEGVHKADTNAITLHTGPGCTMSNEGSISSSVLGNADCNFGNAFQGCQQETKAPFGQAFNAIGGGVYATEWTNTGISIWFFPRSAIPADVSSGNPNPSSWGPPTARFNAVSSDGTTTCNMGTHFREHSIVFNTDFCGDWAGSVWGITPDVADLAPSCEDYVAQNPTAFSNAYWLINSIQVFQQGSGAPTKRTPVEFRA